MFTEEEAEKEEKAEEEEEEEEDAEGWEEEEVYRSEILSLSSSVHGKRYRNNWLWKDVFR